MNRQEVFDKVVRGAAKQRRKSTSRDNGLGGCVYENSRGDRCFIGMLFTGPVPTIMGGASHTEVIAALQRDGYQIAIDPKEAPFPFDNMHYRPKHQGDIHFLDSLQCVHDANEPREWPGELRRFAQRWKLDEKVVMEVDWGELLP